MKYCNIKLFELVLTNTSYYTNKYKRLKSSLKFLVKEHNNPVEKDLKILKLQRQDKTK